MPNRRAKRPLKQEAVTAANQAVRDKTSPPGRSLDPDSPEDAALRTQWMDAYIAAGGETDDPPTPTKPADVVVPCASAGTMPTSAAKDCPDAPKTVTLPPDVNKAIQDGYKASFPKGKSQEHGGTLVKDSKGNIKVVNAGSGTSGTFSPNRTVGKGETIVGTYHTHPYDKSEGGHTGVSFSGADIAYAHYYKEPIYVDAGDKQFMITGTKSTPNVPHAEISSAWDKEFKKLLKSGKSMQDASAGATNAVAQKYNMAYYEGKNGTLKKVSC